MPERGLRFQQVLKNPLTPSTPDTTLVLGVDPGRVTGIALLRRAPLTVLHASTFAVEDDLPGVMTALRAAITAAFAVAPAGAHTRAAIEGWQNIGRITNVHAGIGQVMIGAFTVVTAEVGAETRFLFSGDWKRQYGAESGFLPEAQGRVRKEDVGLARRIQADLGGWPTALDALPHGERGHAINAIALAIHAGNDRVWREASTYPIKVPKRTLG